MHRPPALPLDEVIKLARMYLSDMGFEPDNVCVGCQSPDENNGKPWYLYMEGSHCLFVEGFDYIDVMNQLEELHKQVLRIGVAQYHAQLELEDSQDALPN